VERAHVVLAISFGELDVVGPNANYEGMNHPTNLVGLRGDRDQQIWVAKREPIRE